MAFFYVKRTDGITADQITGLDHLEGLEPLVIIDGSPRGNFLVTGGIITLPLGTQSISEVIVGLEYECEFETLPMMIQSAQGIAFGQHKRVTALGFYAYESLGLSVQLDTHPEDNWDFREGDDRVDQSPPLLSGYKEQIVEGNYTEETTIKVKQTQPFPLNINLMQITLDQSF